MTKEKPIFILIAPTATGKSKTAIELAKKFDLEIINADAYQFFKHMDIGTAKPSLKERETVPHHMFDICEPNEKYSAHQFAKQALNHVEEIFSRGKLPLLVGGAGFYIRAFTTPTSHLPSGTKEYEDLKSAFDWIISKDPGLKDQLHPHDHYRISRAGFLLEMGHVPSKVWQEERKTTLPYPIHYLTISGPRDLLYERMNQRVLDMFEQGLVQETKNILQMFPDAKSRLAKTIGYQQVLQYLAGETTLDACIALTQQKTRNYAKRQMTWIRNQLAPLTSHFEHAFEELSCYIQDLQNL
ncbi:MAG: tRNA (adenosine(37)-N6)-dimethylallyltransferase MiaA [Bdellovibrionales bacterium]|nr:tRNA (adenosine(37)-N6)-dimethylallyltransferase MiaA [Bdellovibrionales bacterium]